jgi:hypothetical protein
MHDFRWPSGILEQIRSPRFNIVVTVEGKGGEMSIRSSGLRPAPSRCLFARSQPEIKHVEAK